MKEYQTAAECLDNARLVSNGLAVVMLHISFNVIFVALYKFICFLGQIYISVFLLLLAPIMSFFV